MGCILGELLGGKPMFQGTTSIHQLDLISQYLGTPTSQDLASFKSSYARKSFDYANSAKRRYLHDLYPKASPDAMDLLQKLLVYNPSKRLSALECINHPYLAKFHKSTVPLLALDYQVKTPFDDNTKLTIHAYRTSLYEGIKKRNYRKPHTQRAAPAPAEKQQADPPRAEPRSAEPAQTSNRYAQHPYKQLAGGGAAPASNVHERANPVAQPTKPFKAADPKYEPTKSAQWEPMQSNRAKHSEEGAKENKTHHQHQAFESKRTSRNSYGKRPANAGSAINGMAALSVRSMQATPKNGYSIIDSVNRKAESRGTSRDTNVPANIFAANDSQKDPPANESG